MMNALIIFLYVNLILLIPCIFYDDQTVYQQLQNIAQLQKLNNKKIRRITK